MSPLRGVRVWGHGFVGAYFDEAGSMPVVLKRYRCPECGVVIRMRPSGYFRRIQARIAEIRRCLWHRIGKGRWPPRSNPARQRHWLRGLRRQVLAHVGMSWAERLEEGFAGLIWGVLKPFSTLPKSSLLLSSSLGYRAGNNSKGGFPWMRNRKSR